MNIYLACAAILSATIFWQAARLWENWRVAKRIGIPIIICPFEPYGAFWQLFSRPFIRVLLPILPESIGAFCRVTAIGWQYSDKGLIHKKLGPIFIIVSPGKNEVVISDPKAVRDVLTQYKDFIKPAIINIHELYGTNLVTTEGQAWARQKKLTAPCFNEGISRSVWDECIRQTQTVLDEYRTPKNVHSTLINDMKTVAFHVLMSTALGISRSSDEKLKPGHSIPFPDALFDLVLNLFQAIIVAPWIKEWAIPLLPKSTKKACIARKECGVYLDEIIAHEKSLDGTPRKPGSRPTLLQALIQASREPTEELKKEAISEGLTSIEMRGNLYIFIFAGFETTANVMSYAVALLAAYPKWQDWIIEEIDSVRNNKDLTEYEQIYPQLKRCQALMFEALRLYGPVTWIPRTTISKPEPVYLSTGEGPIYIPPNTDVHLNMYARQISDKIWGADPLEFRPDRFIFKPTESPPKTWALHGSQQTDTEEKLATPPLSEFSPWSLGPRVCPGMKFSQVEFTAAMWTLFSRSRVHPVLPAGVSPKGNTDAHKTMQDLIEDSAFVAVTLTIRRPEDVRLQWVPR